MKEESQELKIEQVSCSRCETEVCGLSVIPQIAGECSTMEGIQTEGELGLDAALADTKPIDLPCDWTEPEPGQSR